MPGYRAGPGSAFPRPAPRSRALRQCAAAYRSPARLARGGPHARRPAHARAAAATFPSSDVMRSTGRSAIHRDMADLLLKCAGRRGHSQSSTNAAIRPIARAHGLPLFPPAHRTRSNGGTPCPSSIYVTFRSASRRHGTPNPSCSSFSAICRPSAPIGARRSRSTKSVATASSTCTSAKAAVSRTAS